MKILYTNTALDNLAGTECYIRDLVIALHRKYEIEVYTLNGGKIAEEIKSYGIKVTDNLDELSTPDLIHAHHYRTTLHIINKFPKVPVINFCHGRYSEEEKPVFGKNITNVAVDYYCLERLPEGSQVIYNWVDTEKFKQRIKRTGKILIYSNVATVANTEYIEDICLGYEVFIAGLKHNQIIIPENTLSNYDIVFARGKSAMEAMACGCAVILCGDTGMGEMVTTENFFELRKYNFGLKFLSRECTKENVEQEIEKYNFDSAKKVSDLIREHNNFQDILKQILELYRCTLSS